MYITHPLIREKSIESRIYQEKIVGTSLEKNSLVVLPTGLGKTMIAAMITAYRLSKYKGKVLFLAPTKPLVLQHHETFQNLIRVEEIEVFTGVTPPDVRMKGYESSKIIFATPQVIENDLISQRLNLEEFCLVIFDEAHRAVGNYAYVYVSKIYMKKAKHPLMVGLTASPGSSEERLGEVVQNLSIENVEVRTEDSEDVKPYTQDVEIKWVRVSLPPEFKRIERLLNVAYKHQIEILRKLNLVRRKNPTKVQLLELQRRLTERMRKPNPPPYLYPALKAQAAALKLHHGILLLETQGIDSLLSYFKRLESQKAKSAREIVKNQQVKRARLLARNIKLKHPKLTKLSELISENKEKQIIVFSHFRDSAKKITEMLSELEGVRAVRFVGQASKQNDVGLTQKKQKEIIESFKEGNYNVLVATSVAEEGLDIPQVDLVIFYEPVPSEIRAIQRRGRTGRRRSGEVVVLITRETRDEGFYYTARRKEQKMKKLLEGMRAPEEKPSEKQASLDEFSPNIKIICDSRESSSILKKLSEKVKLEIKNLEVGDYVLSERIGVERKTTEDFLKSLIDGRLFSQIRELKQSYLMPLMILEGDDIYNLRKISRNAIQTALISVMCDFKVPVLFTKTEEESAEFLISLAKREQLVKKREVVARGEKKPKSLKERQRFIVEGLPQVSAVLAERLLSRFKTVRDVFKATEEELKNVEGIGKKISREIRDVLDMEWEG